MGKINFKPGDKVEFLSAWKYQFWEMDGLDFNDFFGVVTMVRPEIDCVAVDIFRKSTMEAYHPHGTTTADGGWGFPPSNCRKMKRTRRTAPSKNHAK